MVEHPADSQKYKVIHISHEKQIQHVFTGQQTYDGAGVKLNRILGGQASAQITDPFLMLDHFGSTKVEDYIKGFPWHPHRGIETVTYLLSGKVLHEDSEGHRGVIQTNDLQWMTAGSGIFHQEMPRPLDENDPDELLKAVGVPTNVSGFQLWINLPAKHKMTTPTYRDIKGTLAPLIDAEGGARVKIIAGTYGNEFGPFNGEYGVDPTYLDVSMPEETDFVFPVKKGYNSMVYIVGGKGNFDSEEQNQYIPGQALVYSQDGDFLRARTEDSSLRFIVLSGKPLKEPIWWHGPIVMNSREQIMEAMNDLRNDTFVREKSPTILD